MCTLFAKDSCESWAADIWKGQGRSWRPMKLICKFERYTYKETKSLMLEIATIISHSVLFFLSWMGRIELTLWGQMGGGELKDFSVVWLRFYKKNILWGHVFWASTSKSSVTEVAAYFPVLSISMFVIYFRGVKRLSIMTGDFAAR